MPGKKGIGKTVFSLSKFLKFTANTDIVSLFKKNHFKNKFAL